MNNTLKNVIIGIGSLVIGGGIYHIPDTLFIAGLMPTVFGEIVVSVTGLVATILATFWVLKRLMNPSPKNVTNPTLDGDLIERNQGDN